MDWTLLFKMQRKLDNYIEENHSLTGRNLFEEKILALLVELGELANETRSFKFWRKNKETDQSAITEEYVDGLHFILSLGLEKDFNYDGKLDHSTDVTLNDQLMYIYELVISFKKSPSEMTYNSLFSNYLILGDLLGVSAEQLQAAYFDKNDENFKRQDDGY